LTEKDRQIIIKSLNEKLNLKSKITIEKQKNFDIKIKGIGKEVKRYVILNKENKTQKWTYPGNGINFSINVINENNIVNLNFNDSDSERKDKKYIIILYFLDGTYSLLNV
jgi:hypothetical protein